MGWFMPSNNRWYCNQCGEKEDEEIKRNEECRENEGKFQYKDLTLKEMGKRKKNREREIKNHAFLKSFLEAKR